MNSKHRKTYKSIHEDPVRSNIDWKDIESLLKALDGEISEDRGSRVRVALKGIRAVFHRPHPERVTNKGSVKSVRRFLNEAGVTL